LKITVPSASALTKVYHVEIT